MRRTVIIVDGIIRSFNIWDTCFTNKSLTAEIELHRQIHIDYYSDVEGKPYEDNSPTLCAVMKKKEG
jgi:hypothetical protein